MKKFILILLLFTSGCAVYFKIHRHFNQGEQVLIQKKDSCGRPDRWGEIAYQPNSKDTNGNILYKVRIENKDGWIMPYTENFLDSLNN